MKRILYFCVALLFVTQIFFCYVIANEFQIEYSKESVIADSNDEGVTFDKISGVSTVSAIANNKLTITPHTEFLKVTKTKVVFDIQKDNVWKITFCSICIVIIVTAVIVLLLKIHKSNKK